MSGVSLAVIAAPVAVMIVAALFQLPPQQSDAVIGVSAVHLESGKRISVRGHEPFPMASVFKLPVALAALRRVDTGTLSLTQAITIEPKDFSPGLSPLRDRANGKPVTVTVRELLELTVRESDNTAADNLMKLAGGAKGVTLRVRELGAGGVRVDRSEKEIAADLRKDGGEEAYARDIRDTATPDSMVDLLTAVWQRRAGLSDRSHDLLVRWMKEIPRGQRRILAGAPKGSVVLRRPGTMRGTVNDAGIIELPNGEHVIIAVFTKAAKTSEVPIREDDIAAVTRAAIEHLLH